MKNFIFLNLFFFNFLNKYFIFLCFLEFFFFLPMLVVIVKNENKAFN